MYVGPNVTLDLSGNNIMKKKEKKRFNITRFLKIKKGISINFRKPNNNKSLGIKKGLELSNNKIEESSNNKIEESSNNKIEESSNNKIEEASNNKTEEASNNKIEYSPTGVVLNNILHLTT